MPPYASFRSFVVRTFVMNARRCVLDTAEIVAVSSFSAQDDEKERASVVVQHVGKIPCLHDLAVCGRSILKK